MMTRPRLSIVTPCYNSEAFLGRTLDSVISQKLEGLEHIVMDGGSTDGTHAILDRYRPHLSDVVIGPDQGMYDAINKGFARSSGEVMAWLNSDDVYMPSALNLVVSIFERFPEVEWLTTSKPVIIAATGEIIVVGEVLGFSKDGFLRGENLPVGGFPGTVFIQQESTFWRRSLWDRIGGAIDLDYRMAGDFYLWSRFFDHAELYALDVPIACFRRHRTQKSSMDFASYLAEAEAILARNGGQRENSRRLKLSLLLRTNGWQFLRRPLMQRGWVKGMPVVGYDWGRDDWYLARR